MDTDSTNSRSSRFPGKDGTSMERSSGPLAAPMSPEQEQALRNETWARALGERLESRQEVLASEWRGRPDRWRLVVPERETDPSDPQTHSSPLGAVSWLFPEAVRRMVTPRFWVLLDRLWGVSQADDLPGRIVVTDVEWPEGPMEPPLVTFAGSDLVWGASLLSMLWEVRDEIAPTLSPAALAKVDQLVGNFQAQVEVVERAETGR